MTGIPEMKNSRMLKVRAHLVAPAPPRAEPQLGGARSPQITPCGGSPTLIPCLPAAGRDAGDAAEPQPALRQSHQPPAQDHGQRGRLGGADALGAPPGPQHPLGKGCGRADSDMSPPKQRHWLHRWFLPRLDAGACPTHGEDQPAVQLVHPQRGAELEQGDHARSPDLGGEPPRLGPRNNIPLFENRAGFS